MSVVLNDILRTTCNFSLGGTALYQNIYTHRRTGVGSHTDGEHVAALETWAEAMYGEIVAFVGTSVTGGLASVDKIGWSGAFWEVTEAIGTFSLGYTPSGTANIMPNQVSPYVIFKTARPKSVGKKFIFPHTEEAFGLGLLLAGAVEDIVNYADDALNDITLSALNTLEPGIVRTAANLFLPFTVALVGDVAGTQRRRRLGVGA